jgi:hypothetical protein
MKKNQTKNQETEIVNDYITDVTNSARTRAELIESEWDRKNFAWSQCNATHYMLTQANKKLADERAMQLSQTEEQEAENAGSNKGVDSIIIDRQAQLVEYAINTLLEMRFQHQANLTIYREVAGSDWIAPSKDKARSQAKLKHLASQKDRSALADQLIKGTITH